MTCRKIGEDILEDLPGEDVPAFLVPAAKRAVTIKIEQAFNAWGTAQQRRRSFSAGRVKAFTAGAYSESYFGLEEASKARMLDPDQQVHDLLWSLVTEECRELWLNLWDPDRPDPPMAMAQSFNYGDRPGGGGWPGWPGCC